MKPIQTFEKNKEISNNIKYSNKKSMKMINKNKMK